MLYYFCCIHIPFILLFVLLFSLILLLILCYNVWVGILLTATEGKLTVNFTGYEKLGNFAPIYACMYAREVKPQSPDKMGAQFLLFNRMLPDYRYDNESYSFNITKADVIRSHFLKDRETKIIIHGFINTYRRNNWLDVSLHLITFEILNKINFPSRD